jgi:tetratricopeptide (TPR) repeat protein
VTIVPWAEDSDGSLYSNSNTNLYLIDVTLNNTPDSYGAYFSGSSGQVYPVNGTYFENNQLATYFINSSSFTLSNVHFCENDYDISTDASSSVLAQNVTFSGDPANTTVGNVSYGSYSTCSLGKTSSIASYEDNKKDFAYDEFQKLNVLYQDILAKINSEKVEEHNITKGKYSNDIKSVIKQCKSFIDKNPASCFAPAAISLASHSYKQIEDYEGMKTFVSGIMEDKELLNLYNNAKRSLIDYYNYKEDYEKSLSIADEILNSKTSDENLICDLLLSKGLLYEYTMGKKEEAVKQYELMISGYPQNGITKFAKKQLENLGINADYEIPKETTESTEITEFESSNHPNPFNPTTTISYTLPEAGAVQIKIYDILGREVAKLVDAQKSAGKYSVQWNGSNYASGVYFYSITFNNQRLYKKMLMIK